MSLNAVGLVRRGRSPIFEAQAFDSREFANIVGRESDSAAQRRPRDQQVERADHDSPSLQFIAYARGFSRRIPVKWNFLQVIQHPGQQSATPWTGNSQGSVFKLVSHYARNRDLRRGGAKESCRCRFCAFEAMDDSIRIEQRQTSGSLAVSLPELLRSSASSGKSGKLPMASSTSGDQIFFTFSATCSAIQRPRVDPRIPRRFAPALRSHRSDRSLLAPWILYTVYDIWLRAGKNRRRQGPPVHLQVTAERRGRDRGYLPCLGSPWCPCPASPDRARR
jgi:hypothetical protein